MNKFTMLITFLFTFIISIHIFVTKELPVSHGKDVYIGNFSYIPAFVFLLFSLWVLYNLIISYSKESEEEKQNNE